MDKLYDFRIVLRKAEFSNGFASISFGPSESVYLEMCPECTFADALRIRAEISAKESRSHVAFLSMKYRDDRAAPGIKNHYRLDAPRIKGTP